MRKEQTTPTLGGQAEAAHSLASHRALLISSLSRMTAQYTLENKMLNLKEAWEEGGGGVGGCQSSGAV